MCGNRDDAIFVKNEAELLHIEYAQVLKVDMPIHCKIHYI